MADKSTQKIYKVTLAVTRNEDQDHPGDWAWHHLLDCDVALLEVTEMPVSASGEDPRQLELFPVPF